MVCDEIALIGDALSIEIQLKCPNEYPCQNTTRMINVYSTVYNDFVTTKTLNLTTDDGEVIEMKFCKISIDSNGNLLL